MISFCAVGDVMLGDHPVCYGHGVRSAIDKVGIDQFLAGVRSVLKGADIVTGNLEAGLSTVELRPGQLVSEEMRGRPEYAAGLARAGFNVMTVANNHALHHGEEAFRDTCELLRKSGIAPVGVAQDVDKSNVWRFEKNGVKVAVLGYSVRPEKYRPGIRAYAYGNEAALLEQVRELAVDNTTVVVSIHWGEEYLHTPSPSQVDLGHRLVDAGASIVVGHHPHVLQGVERYKTGWIAYSLGNFAFDHWERSGRETFILKCHITEAGVSDLSCVPVFIGKDLRPVIAEGTSAKRIDETIKELSGQINAFAGRDAEYQQLADRAYLKYRLDSYRYFLTNLWRYRPSIIRQSLSRAAERRRSSNG